MIIYCTVDLEILVNTSKNTRIHLFLKIFCLHKYKILPPLFHIMRTRTCPAMVGSFALREDESTLAL